MVRNSSLWTAAQMAAALFLSGCPTEEEGQSFLPKNDLDVLVEAGVYTAALSTERMTEAQYNATIDSVTSVYTPIFAAIGKNLVVNKQWGSKEVNAYALRGSGDNWIIKFPGGLPRYRGMTQDGFALVVCHEIGHHLGGYPRYDSMWAANEGQSDYFAARRCLQKVWTNQDNGHAADSVDPIARAACDSASAVTSERQLCYRIASAGHATSQVLADLIDDAAPEFGTPDEAVVTRTRDRHPNAQCRLDTYLAGAVCRNPNYDDLVIPSNFTESEEVSCSMFNSYPVGARPRCWYRDPNDAPVNPNVENWDAADDFSAVQGQFGWRYLWYSAPIQVWKQMTLFAAAGDNGNGQWNSGEGYVTASQLMPLGGSGVARAWDAPTDGTYRLSGGAGGSYSCGDGARFKIKKGSKILTSVVLDASSPSYDFDFLVNVNAGQRVMFIVSPRNGGNACDLSTLDLQIARTE